MKRFVLFIWFALAEGLLAPLLAVTAALSRLSPRRIDVGIGPDPLINNVHHARALRAQGWSAETFVSHVHYITDAFDVRPWGARLPRPFGASWLFVRAVFRYRVLFFYLNGGPLQGTRFLRRAEPWLLKLAALPTVVMPYGSDVQDLTRSRNLPFVHAVGQDYPKQGAEHARIATQIDRWSRHASWLISGCEWVDYMYQWDGLMLGHFSIDTEEWKPSPASRRPGPLRVLHAPNHRAIKGTEALVDAVATLQREGVAIELILLERVPNAVIRKAMDDADLVADQFVIGWYAMFAIEAMAMGKPTLCFLRPDLLELYEKASVVKRGEIPLLNTQPHEIRERLKWALDHPDELAAVSSRSRAFVEKHHSLERIGREFSKILETLEVRRRAQEVAGALEGART